MKLPMLFARRNLMMCGRVGRLLNVLLMIRLLVASEKLLLVGSLVLLDRDLVELLKSLVLLDEILKVGVRLRVGLIAVLLAVLMALAVVALGMPLLTTATPRLGIRKSARCMWLTSRLHENLVAPPKTLGLH